MFFHIIFPSHEIKVMIKALYVKRCLRRVSPESCLAAGEFILFFCCFFITLHDPPSDRVVNILPVSQNVLIAEQLSGLSSHQWLQMNWLAKV